MAKRNQQKNQKIKLAQSGGSLAGHISSHLVFGSDDLSSIFGEARSIFITIKKIKATQLSSSVLRERIKQLVKDYFRKLRPELLNGGIVTENIDEMMQKLMNMANSYARVKVYRRVFYSLCRQLGNIEVSREYIKSNHIAQANAGNKSGLVNNQQKSILVTLRNLIPAAALSYEQALVDLRGSRISYRGTVAELREVLREVLDHLAPDQEVAGARKFQFEEGRSKPTMKQKVRFILRSRNKTATTAEPPEEAASIVDDGIAKLVRATYNRSSLSAHTQSDNKSEVFQIKMYLDSVLCELLEIH